jgi:hypothetical protein
VDDGVSVLSVGVEVAHQLRGAEALAFELGVAEDEALEVAEIGRR